MSYLLDMTSCLTSFSVSQNYGQAIIGFGRSAVGDGGEKILTFMHQPQSF